MELGIGLDLCPNFQVREGRSRSNNNPDDTISLLDFSQQPNEKAAGAKKKKENEKVKPCIFSLQVFDFFFPQETLD